MKTASQTLFFLGITLHLLLIIGHNVLAIADAIHDVYGLRPLSAATTRGLRGILSSPPFAGHGVLTGVGMGYGFYAPQVGSPYVAAFERLSGSTRDTLFHPGLRTRTGIMRFTSALAIFQWFTPSSPATSPHIASQLVSQLTLRYRQRTGADSVHCRIFRLQPPSFQRPSGGIRWRCIYPAP